MLTNVQVRTRGGRVAGRALTAFVQPSSSDEEAGGGGGGGDGGGGGGESDSDDYDPAQELLARQQV